MTRPALCRRWRSLSRPRWASSWSSTTGTIGVSTSLNRSQTVTVQAGVDGRFLGRVGWTDENGNVTYKGFSIDLNNLQDLSGDFEISAADATPQYVGGSGFETSQQIDDSLGFALMPQVVGLNKWAAALTLPKGVTITSCESKLYRGGSGDSAIVELYKQSSDDTKQLKNTMTHGVTGWQTVNSGALAEVTGNDRWFIWIKLNPASSNIDARFGSFRILYDRPSVKRVI